MSNAANNAAGTSTDHNGQPGPSNEAGGSVGSAQSQNASANSSLNDALNASMSDGNDSSGSAVSGGQAPGQNENKGGTGGGLAGAGNNAYFHRFGEHTTPREPEMYTYTDTYKRSFAVHTNFPDPSIKLTKIYQQNYEPADKAESSPLKYNTKFYPCEFDHGGIHFPYWIQQASMRTCDWNKPDDHIAYEVEEYGFTVPNLRLNKETF